PRHGDDRLDDREIAHVGHEVAHEAAVDLEVVDPPALEVGEARIPRPEIIDRDARTELTQAHDGILGRLTVAAFTPLEYRALGELELQHVGVDAMRAGQPRDRKSTRLNSSHDQ